MPRKTASNTAAIPEKLTITPKFQTGEEVYLLSDIRSSDPEPKTVDWIKIRVYDSSTFRPNTGINYMLCRGGDKEYEEKELLSPQEFEAVHKALADLNKKDGTK